MAEGREQELIALNQKLLDAIAEGDWESYEELCDATLTAFEPEARGHLVAGLEFHRYYFDRHGGHSAHSSTISSPHVRLLGDDVAVVSYVRLIQRQEPDGNFASLAFEETRVWQQRGGRWVHVHFHRSSNP